jgi:hypothetical protein
MDEVEARSILDDTLSRLRGLAFSELVERYLGEIDAFEVAGRSGAEYQIEVEAFWDDPRVQGGNLRVMAAIDDGRGWRSIAPLTDSFIKAPDGTLVGE